MARTITCTLPNASDNINGIRFIKQDDDSGMMATVEDDSLADQFDGIPGYVIADVVAVATDIVDKTATVDAEKRSPGRPPKQTDEAK